MHNNGRRKLGFYPTDLRAVDAIASWVRLPPGQHIRMIDNCAGEGEALARLATILRSGYPQTTIETYGIELEPGRADAAEKRLDHMLKAVNATEEVAIAAGTGQNKQGQFHIWFCNPPYDYSTSEGKRLEQVFLRCGTEGHEQPILVPGGLLIFVIQRHRLNVFAEKLARYYHIGITASDGTHRVSVVRFPDFGGLYDQFGQAVVFATRRETPLLFVDKTYPDVVELCRLAALDEDNAEQWATIRQLGAFPTNGPEEKKFVVPGGIKQDIVFRSKVFDGPNAFKLAHREGLAKDPEWINLILPPGEHTIEAPLRTLQPGHTARLLAAGLMNNMRLDGHCSGDDHSECHHPMMIRGQTQAVDVCVNVELRERTTQDGDIEYYDMQTNRTSYITVISAFDLITAEWHFLSTVPGENKSSKWVGPDSFIIEYAEELRLIAQRHYPPIYDNDHIETSQWPHIDFNETLRKPLGAQEEMIEVITAGLMRGMPTLLCGEMGVGKSLVGALAFYYAHKKKPYAACIVLSPPTMVLKWKAEFEKTCPDADENYGGDTYQGRRGVFVLRTITDLHDSGFLRARYIVISQTAAKLGNLRRPAADPRFIVWRSQEYNAEGIKPLEYQLVFRCPDCGAVYFKKMAPAKLKDISGDNCSQRCQAPRTQLVLNRESKGGIKRFFGYCTNKTVTAIFASGKREVQTYLFGYSQTDEQRYPTDYERWQKDPQVIEIKEEAVQFSEPVRFIMIHGEAVPTCAGASYKGGHHDYGYLTYDRVQQTNRRGQPIKCNAPLWQQVAGTNIGAIPPENKRKVKISIEDNADETVDYSTFLSRGSQNVGMCARPYVVELTPRFKRDIPSEDGTIMQWRLVNGTWTQIRVKRIARHFDLKEEPQDPVGFYTTRAPKMALDLWIKNKLRRQEGLRWWYEHEGTMWSRNKQGQMVAPRPAKKWIETIFVDEAHEYSAEGSAQGQAMATLVQAVGMKVIALTGTFSNGYASGLFYQLYRMFPKFRKEYGYHDMSKWVKKYGVIEQKIMTSAGGGEEIGAISRRHANIGARQPKERPGFASPGLTRILPHAGYIWLHQVSEALPPYHEYIVPIQMNAAQATAYGTVYGAIKNVFKDRTSLGARLRSAALQMGITFATLPCRHWSLIDKGIDHKQNNVIFQHPGIEDGIYPKEEMLISLCLAEKAKGRKTLVYCTHTNTYDIPARLARKLTDAGLRVKILRTSTCKTEERQGWIESHASEMDVMITHPMMVKVGLDLLAFPTIVFYEVVYSIQTLLQASRRSWRIGQEEEVNVYFFAYEATMEQDALILIAKKRRAVAGVDGVFLLESQLGGDDNDDLVDALARQIIGEQHDQVIDAVNIADMIIKDAAAAFQPISRVAIHPPIILDPNKEPDPVVDVPVVFAEAKLIVMDNQWEQLRQQQIEAAKKRAKKKVVVAEGQPTLF